tara:strand:- start:1 stop:426 length:426 start_codon:yes stop_codon:yes gene_type:complete
MATTTASISISSNIMNYPTNINKTMTMKKLASCHGLEETSGLNSKKFNAATAVTVIDNTEGTAAKANKVYMRNTGSDKSQYFYVALHTSTAAAATAEAIGKLYGGDWMLMPWEATAAASHDITVVPSTADTMTLEWMIFQE